MAQQLGPNRKKMTTVRLLLASLFLVGAVQATSEPVSVAGMIQRALVDRSDASRILHYFRMSSKDLQNTLPAFSGGKLSKLMSKSTGNVLIICFILIISIAGNSNTYT